MKETKTEWSISSDKHKEFKLTFEPKVGFSTINYILKLIIELLRKQLKDSSEDGKHIRILKPRVVKKFTITDITNNRKWNVKATYGKNDMWDIIKQECWISHFEKIVHVKINDIDRIKG